MSNNNKNKDILKTISEKFIKPKQEEVTETVNVTKNTVKDEVEVTPIQKHIALDLLKVGRDYLAVEIEYDLNTMTAKVLASTPFDNRVAGLSFHHGRMGIESIMNRTKRHQK